MGPYIRAALLGAVLGLLVASAGSWREQVETGTSTLTSLGPVFRFALPALGGAVGGIVFVATRVMRERGRPAYYLSWSLVGAVSFSAFMAPDVVSSGEWGMFPLAMALGVGAGLGLGLFVRQVTGEKW